MAFVVHYKPFQLAKLMAFEYTTVQQQVSNASGKKLPGFCFTPPSDHPQHEITTDAFAITLQFPGICSNSSMMATASSGILL